MAPDDERDLIEAVVTCEGNLHDPDFSERFQTLVNKLKTVLYTTKEEPFKIRKVEPWNSVRVTISIPKEAAQRLRVLAQQGSHVLRQLGILSVQVEGDQVISLTLAGRYNNEPQEVILRPTDAPNSSTPLATSASSSSSLPSTSTVPLPVAAISATPVAGPSGVTLDILSSSTSSAFRSPNVVAPSGEAIPLPPKNASGAPRPPLGGPFPFASMTHAAQAMQRIESSNPLINTANSTNNSPSPSISPAPSGVLSTPSTPNPTVNAVLPVNNNSIAPANSSVGASQQTTVTIPVLVQTQTANHTAPVSVGLSVQGVPLTNINLTNVTVKSDQVTRYILNSSSNVNTNAISQASPSQSLQLQLVNVNVPPPYPGVNSNSSSGNNVNNNNNTNSSNHLVHHHHHHLKQQQVLNSTRTAVTSSSNSSATVTMVGAATAGVSVGQSSSQSSGGKNNGNFITPSEPVRLSGSGTLKTRTVGQVQGEAKSKPSQPPPHAVLKSLLAQGKEPSTHQHSSQGPPQLTSSGKPRQFLINPLTGHLEPMPSESSSESEASEDDDETEVVQHSRGKGSRLLLTANMMKSVNVHNLPSNIQMSDTAKAIASIESASSSLMQKINASLNPQRIIRPGSPASSSGRKSRDESSIPSLSSKDIKEKDTSPVVVNSVPGEKIKLRLKLEKSEPVMSSAYKVEYMKKSEKSSLSSSSATLSSSLSSTSGGTSPAPGEQPRVPPLHISIRGKNAAVVVSPRREDKDKDFSKSMLEQSLGTISSSASSEKLMNSFKLQNTKRIKSRLKSSDSTNSNDSEKFSGSSKKATKISRPRLSKDNSSGSSWNESTSIPSGSVDGVEDPLKSRLYSSEEKSQNQTIECNHASAVVEKVSNFSSKKEAGGLVDLISGNSSMTNTLGKVKKSRRKSELLSSRNTDLGSSTLPLNVTSQSAEMAHAQGTQLMKHLSQSQSSVVNDFSVHETIVGRTRTPPGTFSCDIDSKETSKAPEKVSVSTSTPGGLIPSTSSTLIAKDSLSNAPKGNPKPPDIPKLQKGSVPKDLEITPAQVNTVIPETKVSKSPKPMPELLALPLSSPDKSTDHSHFSISSNPHHPLTQFHHQTTQSKEPKSHPGTSANPSSASPSANSAILSRSLMTEMVNAALRTSQSSVTPSLLSQQQSQSQQSSQSQLLSKLLSDRQKQKEKDVIQNSSFPQSSASNTSLPVLKEKERDQSNKPTLGVSSSPISSALPSSNLSNRVKGNTPAILRSRVQSSSSPRVSTGTSTDKEQTPVPMPTLTPSPALKSLLEKRKQQIPSSILPVPPIQTHTHSQKSSQETTEEMEAEVAKVQKRLNQIGGVEIEVRKINTENVTMSNKTLRDKVEVEVQLCVSPSTISDPKSEPPSTAESSSSVPPSLDSATPISALKSELVTMGAPVQDGSGGSVSSSNTNLNASALSLPLAVALPPITKAEDPSGAPGEDSGIDSMDALSEKSPNQGESPARKESDQFCDSSSVTTTKSSHFVDTTNTNVVNSNCNNIKSIDASNPIPPDLLMQTADKELEPDLDKDLQDDGKTTIENNVVLTITCSSIHPPTPMEIIDEKDEVMEVASVNESQKSGEECIGDGIVKGADSPVRNQVPCESIDITVNKNQSMQMKEMPTNPVVESQITGMEIDSVSTSVVMAQPPIIQEPSQSLSAPSPTKTTLQVVVERVCERTEAEVFVPVRTANVPKPIQIVKAPETPAKMVVDPPSLTTKVFEPPTSTLEEKEEPVVTNSTHNPRLDVVKSSVSQFPESQISQKSESVQDEKQETVQKSKVAKQILPNDTPRSKQLTTTESTQSVTVPLPLPITVTEEAKLISSSDLVKASAESEGNKICKNSISSVPKNVELKITVDGKINSEKDKAPVMSKTVPAICALPVTVAVVTNKEVSPNVPSNSKITAIKVSPESQGAVKIQQIPKAKDSASSTVSTTTIKGIVNVPAKPNVKDNRSETESKIIKENFHSVKTQSDPPHKPVKVEIVSESALFTKSPIKIHTVKCDVEKVTTPTQTEIKGVPRHYNIITPRPYVSVVEQKPITKDTVTTGISQSKPKVTIVVEPNRTPSKPVAVPIVTTNSAEKPEKVVVDVKPDNNVSSSHPSNPESLTVSVNSSEIKPISGQKDEQDKNLAGASTEKPVKLGIEAISAALKGRAAASLMQPKVNTVVASVKPSLPFAPTLKQVQITIPKEPVVKVEKEIQTAKYVPMRKQMEMLEAHKAALATQKAQRAVSAAGLGTANEVKKSNPQPADAIKAQSPAKQDGPEKQSDDKMQVIEVVKIEKLEMPIIQATKSKPLPETIKGEQCNSSVAKDILVSPSVVDKSKEVVTSIPVAKEQIAEITAVVKKVETENTALNTNTSSHNSSSGRVMPTQANLMPKPKEPIGTSEKSEDKCDAKSGEPMERSFVTVVNENVPKKIEQKQSEAVMSCQPLQRPPPPSVLPVVPDEKEKDPIAANPTIDVEKEKEKILIPSSTKPITTKSKEVKEDIPVKSTLEAKQSKVIEIDERGKKKEKVYLSSHVKDTVSEEFEPMPVKIIEPRVSFNPQVSAHVEVDELKSQLARKNNTPIQPAPLHNQTKDIKLDGSVKVVPRAPETHVEVKSTNALSGVMLKSTTKAQPTNVESQMELSSPSTASLDGVAENTTKIKTAATEPSDNPPALLPAIETNPPAISGMPQQHAKSLSCSPPKLQKAEPPQIKLSPESNSSNRVFQDKPPKLSKATETDKPIIVAAVQPEQRKTEEKEKERPKTELKTQMNLIAPGGKIQFQSLNPNQSINLARTLPNMIQLSKAPTATLQTGISKIPIVSAASQCVSTKVSPMVTLASISVPSMQGGSTTTAGGTGQTVFAIHPNVSLPANISHHLQHHHSSSIRVIPTNPKMLPIKLVTLPKQTQTQLQSLPNLSRSSQLEAVNIVTNTSGRAGSPNPKGIPVQNTPLNLGSVSVPGGNIHLVPISVASAAGGTASPVKVLVSSPVKMQPMLLKSVMMAGPQTTIRVVRPDLRPQIQVQQEVKKVEAVLPPKATPTNTTETVTHPAKEEKESMKLSNARSPTSDSMYKDVDGVEILDTGSPGTNEEDLPFEADIIHDEKDLADVLAGEIIDTEDVIENGIEMSCLDGPYDFGKDGEDSPSHRDSIDSPDFQRFSTSSKGFKSSWHPSTAKKEESKGHLNSMPDSPIPVMRSSSPLYTYSNSNRSARNSRSRSPSPPESDVHGEDQEIIDCLSRSPSQPKLSPQNKPPPILERESNDYGSPVKPELVADHTYMLTNSMISSGETKGKLDEELSIEIPSVDSPVSHQNADERKSTRSTRSNTRLVSPDITAFRSDTPKPQKFTSKPDTSVLKNSPKPSPTGSVKMLSPTVVGTPSSSTRSSPISNQLLISTPAAATIALNSSSRGKTPVTNKRKRQESDSSSASKDENMEEKSEIDLNSRPGKRRCSENAAELIKACIGVEDTPKRNSSLIKKMEDSKGKDLKGKMTMMTVVEETEDQLDLLLGDPTLRTKGGRSSRGSSEDRSSSRGSSVHRNTAPSRAVTAKDEEQRDAKTNSRVNNRVKDNATKTKSGTDSPHINSTPLNKKSAGRRSNRSVLAKEKSPLTPAKTRTNVRKDPVVLSGGSADKSSTPSTSPENENPRRKTRSSVAVGMSDSEMQSFKRRRISKDTKS